MRQTKFFIMKQLLLLIVLYAGLMSFTGFAQSEIVTGKVINDKGDAVPFATVKIKNSKVGTASDEQGVFSIKSNTGDILVISSTGFTLKKFLLALKIISLFHWHRFQRN